jgi:homoaconitase/3-isopropylmalate dehydratase large subunit
MTQAAKLRIKEREETVESNRADKNQEDINHAARELKCLPKLQQEYRELTIKLFGEARNPKFFKTLNELISAIEDIKATLELPDHQMPNLKSNYNGQSKNVKN